MNINEVIRQLRTYCPAFENRVWGAAKYGQALANNADVGLVYPSAFVLPLADDATGNQQQTGLWQTVTENISVFVIFDNNADNVGGYAANIVEEMRNEIFKAILNWRIDDVESQRGIYYNGGKIEDYDRARLFYQYVFSLDHTVTDRDGFQPAYPELTDITVFDTSHPPLSFDIPQTELL